MPSFILIRTTVWPVHERYRQTDREDRQRTDSIGRTVLQTVAQKRFDKQENPAFRIEKSSV